MALSLWMVAKTWQQCTTDDKLSCIGKESNYPYLGVTSAREKAVEYAKQHMAKDQRGDDWQDQCVMVKIQFTAKGVAFYRTTPADNVRPPMPMLRKLCYKPLTNDEGQWHLLGDIPFKEMHDGERIVTIFRGALTLDEKVKLGKKVSESPPKKLRAAENLEKLEEVEGEAKEWKRQEMCPLQDGGKRGLVFYMVVETEWVKAHLHLLQKNAQDQKYPEHEEFKKRYVELRKKHASEIKEEKPIIHLCQHGYKRPRARWSIDLFESKPRAIDLMRQKMKRRVLESQSYAVLAVQFSTQALAEALIETEEETPKFKTRLLRAENKDIHCERGTWSWNGPLLPLFSPQVSAWMERATRD